MRGPWRECLKCSRKTVPVERSAGVILFRNAAAGRRYLVIRSTLSEAKIAKGKKMREFWDFPKGLLDKGEDGLAAAKREAREEAGIKEYKLVPEFKTTVRYFVRGRPWGNRAAMKFVAMFLAEARTEKVKLSWEHDKYEWLFYKEAKNRISRHEMGKALEEAEKFLRPFKKERR